jgi:hypothetical protein
MDARYLTFMAAQATLVLVLAWDMDGYISKLMLMYGAMILGHVLTELFNQGETS